MLEFGPLKELHSSLHFLPQAHSRLPPSCSLGNCREVKGRVALPGGLREEDLAPENAVQFTKMCLKTFVSWDRPGLGLWKGSWARALCHSSTSTKLLLCAKDHERPWTPKEGHQTGERGQFCPGTRSCPPGEQSGARGAAGGAVPVTRPRVEAL